MRQRDGHAAGYHSALAVRVRQRLDIAALRSALDALVARHEVLRTVLAWSDGALVQRVLPAGPVDLIVEAAPAGTVADGLEGWLADRVTSVFREPFDLAAAPPLRPYVFRLGARDHLIFLVVHHITAHGWSMDLAHQELSELYSAASQRREPSLPELTIQHADYARWLHDRGDGDGLEFWLSRLADVPTVLELPGGRRWSTAPSFRGDRVTVPLPNSTVDAVRQLARAENTTEFVVYLAAFHLLLARWSGQRELLVGVPVANRTLPETEPLIGCFANLLPLRLRLDERDTFRQLVRQVGAEVLESLEHQDTPFERIVERLAPRRSPAHHPLVQVMFTMLDPGAASGSPSRATGTPLGERVDFRYDSTAHVDVTCLVDVRAAMPAVDVRGGTPTVDLHFATDRFERATIRRAAERLVLLLAGATRQPDEALARLPSASHTESASHAERHAGRGRPGRAHRPAFIHERIAAVAARQPHATAVVDGDTSYTFAELDDRSDRLAALLAASGVGPEDPGAVCLGRGFDLVVALLGVLKSGGVYLPLDPTYPPDRRSHLLADSGATVVVTRADAATDLAWPPGVQTILLDDPATPLPASAPPPRPAIRPDGVAYVLYTSGSTGRPKAAEVTHAGLDNVCAWYAEFLGLGPDDRVSQLVTPGCDASLLDMLPTLAAGARIVVPTQAQGTDLRGLWQWFAEAGVTTSFLVTPLFLAATETLPARHPTLRRVQVGGDRLPAVPAGLPFRLANVYGPTETAIAASGGWVTPGDAPHIGTAVDGATLYLLDEWLRPVPAGMVGELYVAGPGVARGYRGQPGLTAAAFLPDPFAGDGGRMYRTGDRARWTGEWRLEFLGRGDDQVKIRGFRVEPGEVEAALVGLPEVIEAAVVVRDDLPGGRGLVAFYRAAGDLPPAAVRQRLARQLPSFMVPARFVRLREFALNAHGKVDRAALARYDIRDGALTGARPTGPIQELVAEVWRELLGVERVSATDDFFQLGGHSLVAMRVVSRVAEAIRCPVPTPLLFEAPDLASFAQAVEDIILARSAGADQPVAQGPAGGPG